MRNKIISAIAAAAIGASTIAPAYSAVISYDPSQPRWGDALAQYNAGVTDKLLTHWPVASESSPAFENGYIFGNVLKPGTPLPFINDLGTLNKVIKKNKDKGVTLVASSDFIIPTNPILCEVARQNLMDCGVFTENFMINSSDLSADEVREQLMNTTKMITNFAVKTEIVEIPKEIKVIEEIIKVIDNTDTATIEKLENQIVNLKSDIKIAQDDLVDVQDAFNTYQNTFKFTQEALNKAFNDGKAAGSEDAYKLGKDVGIDLSAAEIINLAESKGYTLTIAEVGETKLDMIKGLAKSLYNHGYMAGMSAASGQWSQGFNFYMNNVAPIQIQQATEIGEAVGYNQAINDAAAAVFSTAGLDLTVVDGAWNFTVSGGTPSFTWDNSQDALDANLAPSEILHTTADISKEDSVITTIFGSDYAVGDTTVVNGVTYIIDSIVDDVVSINKFTGPSVFDNALADAKAKTMTQSVSLNPIEDEFVETSQIDVNYIIENGYTSFGGNTITISETPIAEGSNLYPILVNGVETLQYVELTADSIASLINDAGYSWSGIKASINVNVFDNNIAELQADINFDGSYSILQNGLIAVQLSALEKAIDDAVSEAYSQGYSDGYADGYKDGFADGFEAGQSTK